MRARIFDESIACLGFKSAEFDTSDTHADPAPLSAVFLRHPEVRKSMRITAIAGHKRTPGQFAQDYRIMPCDMMAHADPAVDRLDAYLLNITLDVIRL